MERKTGWYEVHVSGFEVIPLYWNSDTAKWFHGDDERVRDEDIIEPIGPRIHLSTDHDEPITAEWLEGIGFTMFVKPNVLEMELLDSRKKPFWIYHRINTSETYTTTRDFIFTITTRRALLGLLASLGWKKKGETK